MFHTDESRRYAPVTVSWDVRATRKDESGSAEAEDVLVQCREATLTCVGLGRPSHSTV